MKRPGRVWLVHGLLSLMLGLAGCGYQPVYGARSIPQLCVTAAAPQVADFGAVQAALNGARGELARAGALATSTERPCLVIELLRVEEAPTGIALGAADGRERPLARGSNVRVWARGWVESSASAVSRDTGDMVRDARAATSPSVVEDSRNYRRLVRGAAEAVGRAIAQRILGLPTPTR